MSMSDNPEALPPLPKPRRKAGDTFMPVCDYYGADQMRDYARAALAQQAATPIVPDPMQDPKRPGYFMNYAKDETPAEMVLRKLACWLGAGGYNAPTVDADVFHDKIVWGVENAIAAARQAATPAPAEPVVRAGDEREASK